MESEKKGSRTRVDEKGEEGGRKKRRNGMEKKGTSTLFLFFPFFVSFFPFFLFRRHSFAFPLCPLYSVREISRSSASSHSVFFEHTFLLWAKFNLPFSIPGKWRTVVRNTLRNNAKTEDIIRYLLYFVPIFVHANFDFSHHLEFVNLEFIESKDLIRRKFVQINTNMSLIFV